MKRKGKFISVLVVSLLVFQMTLSQNSEAASAIGNLVLKTNGGGFRPDYAWHIAKNLRELGIEIEIRVEEWSVFVGALLETHDYDMGIVGLNTGIPSFDYRNVYTENGNMNICELDVDMPYGNISETMQEEIFNIANLEARIQKFYEWQNLMMDKIVPILPLYSPQIFSGVWSNFKGYNAELGLAASLPEMYCDGYHQGQHSLTEINLKDDFHNIHSLDTCDCTQVALLWDLIAQPLFDHNEDKLPTKTGIIRDWEFLTNTHAVFYVRDGLFWNPSYDIRDRTELSDSLQSIPSSELMRGLKNNEYSDGTNQPITAKDAVFSFLMRAVEFTRFSAGRYDWISSLYVDPMDPLKFHIHIDGNPATPEREPYPEFIDALDLYAFPEFFLNSTDATLRYTYGGAPYVGLGDFTWYTSQWASWKASPFGCGTYMIDYLDYDNEALLRYSPFQTKPNIETVKLHEIIDYAESISMFTNGFLDFSEWINQFPEIRRQLQADDRFDIQSVAQDYMLLLFFNLQRPFVGGADNYVYLDAAGKEDYTKGVSVRKAICYSIDRVEMNEKLHNGDYIISDSIVSPSKGYYYYDDIVKYNFDLYSAKDWFCSSCYCPVYPTPTIETTTTNILITLSILGLGVITISKARLKGRN